MASYPLEILATDQNFDEAAYLLANPDVADAVRKGHMASGRSHFEAFGRQEGRRLRRPMGAQSPIAQAKRQKLARVRPLLRSDMPFVETPLYFDFLTDELRAAFNIVDTEAESSNPYDRFAMELIEKNRDGLVLDCGAGRRPEYFDNVVNFEIAHYETTDVRGVGEKLPFLDGSFDAVISLAVLEHVKDPFRCAKEISRVLKPGASLMCCVPFLQPMHAYPHHYYNMTSEGIRNLFADELDIERVTVYESILPIWSLTWMLRSWAAGLRGRARQEFLEMRVAELTDNAGKFLDRAFVKELSEEKNLELASATVLFARKPGKAR
jgi:SAM-dependent methyltransferase